MIKKKRRRLMCLMLLVIVLTVWDLTSKHKTSNYSKDLLVPQQIVQPNQCNQQHNLGVSANQQFSEFKRRFPKYKQQPAKVEWLRTMATWQMDKKWKKLKRFLRHYEESQVEFQDNYSYQHKIQNHIDKGCLTTTLQFHEYNNGVTTQGGSRFTVYVKNLWGQEGQDGQDGQKRNWTNAFFDIGNVTDHFNGSYSLTYPVRARCSVVSVFLEYVNFNAFKGPARNIAQLVFNQTICMPKNTAILDLDSASTLSGWDEIIGDLVYNDNGSLYPSKSISEPCEKLDRYSQIFLAGASHMRLLNWYYSWTCTAQKIFKFQYFRHVSQLSSIVSDFIELTTALYHKKSVTFVVQSGVWDLCYATTSYEKIFTTVIKQYIEALKKLVIFAKSRQGFMHIQILTTPARGLRQYYLRTCNNYVIAIFNDLLKNELQSLIQIHKLKDSVNVRIHVLDTFDLTSPVSNKTVDYVHYMGCEKPDCYGNVGIAIAQMVLEKVVEDYK